ncbi:hypothetical protein CsSME_00042802 [Camellia sinensis var. sinensis]
MYRSMRSDHSKQDRSSNQQRKQSFEDHYDDDGCVDQENEVCCYHPSLKPIEESDSHFIYTSPPLPPPLPTKRTCNAAAAKEEEYVRQSPIRTVLMIIYSSSSSLSLSLLWLRKVG